MDNRPAAKIVDDVLSRSKELPSLTDCQTCGCGRPWDDHGVKGLKTKGKKPKAKKAKMESRPLFIIQGKKARPVMERHWILSLGIDLNSEEFEEVDPVEAKEKIIAKLEAKKPEVARLLPGGIDKFIEVIDELHMCADEEESIDFVLQMLYDWADENSVWVGNDNGGPQSYSRTGSIDL